MPKPPIDYQQLAKVAMDTAVDRYGRKGARYDVIVECMTLTEIAGELERDGVRTVQAAIRWTARQAKGQHEQELNQAWDGPESVRSSTRYDPRHDPAN